MIRAKLCMCVLSVITMLIDQVQKSSIRPCMHVYKVLHVSSLALAACGRARVRRPASPQPA